MKRSERVEVRSNVSVRESVGARMKERDRSGGEEEKKEGRRTQKERERERKGEGDQGTGERGGGREGQEGMHGNEAQAGRPRFARPAFHQRQGELSGSFSSVSPEGIKGERERATGHGLTP